MNRPVKRPLINPRVDPVTRRVQLRFGHVPGAIRRTAMRSPVEVLLVGDGSPVLNFIGGALDSLGCRVSQADDVGDALSALAGKTFDLLILVLAKGQTDSQILLRRLSPRTELIILSEEVRLPLEAYQAEAADYIFLPCRPVEIRRRILRALERLQVKSTAAQTEARLNQINQRVYDRIAHTVQHINASLQTITSGMEQLHRKIRNIKDMELNRICQEIYNQFLDVTGSTREFTDSLAKAKSLNLSDDHGRPSVMSLKDRATRRFPKTKQLHWL
jgi:DNA-binding response OmpR family regulator